MSSQESLRRRDLKKYVRDASRRKSSLNVDLNAPPPAFEAQSSEGTSVPAAAAANAGMAASPINVEAIEDEDVQLLSSLRALPQARNWSRSQPMTVVLDEGPELSTGTSVVNVDDHLSRLPLNSFRRRWRLSPNRVIINCEAYENVQDDRNAKIFPGDLHLEGIINAVKSSRFLPIPMVEDSLGWFIRQIQQCIILCTLRRQLVKDASKSRYSFVYSDPDETITAHLQGNFVALVKISLGWPLSSYPLMLCSLKISDDHSKCIPMSFLCKIQEKANCLEIPTRQNLVQFADAIEQLVKEMQPENLNSTSS